MSKVFIANCSAQEFDFVVRIPEAGVVRQLIPIGTQIQIPMDLNPFQVEAIVQQHAPYGMVSVTEIDRTKTFVGVCYSLDKRVDMEKVRRVIEKNFEILDARGKKIREEAAVAVNAAVENSVRNLRSNSTLREMEFSVQEVERQGFDTEVNESITVSRSQDQSPRAPRGRARKAG